MSDTPEIYCTASVSVTCRIPLKSIFAQLWSLSRCWLYWLCAKLCLGVLPNSCLCFQLQLLLLSGQQVFKKRPLQAGNNQLAPTAANQFASLGSWGICVCVSLCVCLCVCVCVHAYVRACMCVCFVSVTQNAQIDMVSMEMSTFVLVSVMSSKLATGLMGNECI